MTSFLRRSISVSSALTGLLLLLSFSGCRQGSSKAQGESAPTANGSSAAQEINQSGRVTYPEGDYVQQQPGRAGGTLRIATKTDLTNLDPHGVSSVYIQWFGRMLFDNLVYLDAQGVAQPWLASSWTISSDGLTYTFHLRTDVTFSDGSRFDAEALRLNLEHMRDPATKSPLAGRYIVPYRDGKALDDFTFEAHLSYPYTPFLEVLAQSWLAILSPKQIRENPKSILSAPIGSGPYILESYRRQQGLTFVKRPDYHWPPPSIKHEGPAYIDRIAIEIVAEDLVRYTALAADQYDLTFEAPAPNAAAIRADAALTLDRRIRKGIPLRGLTFNFDQVPFDDIKVRRAISLAIDREGIVQLVGFGEFAPKSDYLAATTRFYDPAFRDVLKYDPAAANRLLDEAGWTGRDAGGFRTKGGKRLGAEFLTTETATPAPTSVAIQSDLKKVGFDLHIVQMPLPQITDRRNAGSYQAVMGGVWHTNTPDALYINFHSEEISSPSHLGQNSAHLRDPLLDDLLARARRTTDPALLQDLYSQAQHRLVELVPSITLYENYTSVAYRRKVHGILFDTSHNTPVFTGAWLAEDK